MPVTSNVVQPVSVSPNAFFETDLLDEHEFTGRRQDEHPGRGLTVIIGRASRLPTCLFSKLHEEQAF